MGFFWKFPAFLALSILVLYQAGLLQAAPIRAALESRPYLASLPEEDRRLLLIELVKAYMQMKADEVEQERETRDSSLDGSKAAKRCSNLSTCVLGAYTQDLNKYRTFPQTAVGVGAPGKKRVMAGILERDHGPHVGMPQDTHVSAQKRACYTATCLTHHLAGLLSSSKNRAKNNLLPMNMGFRPNGRRRMNFRN